MPHSYILSTFVKILNRPIHMKILLSLILSLSFYLCSYAILPMQFHFRHYNIENGISANNISALLQDQKGFIWIGTDYGLSRFDGNQFTFYQKTNPHYSNFHANSINTICETNSNEPQIRNL